MNLSPLRLWLLGSEGPVPGAGSGRLRLPCWDRGWLDCDGSDLNVSLGNGRGSLRVAGCRSSVSRQKETSHHGHNEQRGANESLLHLLLPFHQRSTAWITLHPAQLDSSESA